MKIKQHENIAAKFCMSILRKGCALPHSLQLQAAISFQSYIFIKTEPILDGRQSEEEKAPSGGNRD
jgi:hypothetical protein